MINIVEIRTDDIVGLLNSIESSDMNQIAEDRGRAQEIAKFHKKWKITLSIVTTVAAVAGLVSAVAYLLFTADIIQVSCCTKALAGSALGILSAAGGLYFPITNALAALKDQAEEKTAQNTLFGRFKRAKELLKLQTNEEKKTTHLQKLWTLMEKARAVFPQSVHSPELSIADLTI